jgi:hypothetical protein
VKKGTYTATVTWKVGSFKTSTAKTTIKVTEYAKPSKAAIESKPDTPAK